MTNTMDSILDMMGREINDEERRKLAASIEIVPDSQMMYTDKGPVDIILNSSGAIRRLNSGQLYEVDLNFASEWIREEVVKAPTMEEKENLIFTFLSIVNEDQYEFFYNMYSSYDKLYTVNGHTLRLYDQLSKEAFIKDIENNGFYLVKPPDSNIRYETMKKIYDTFPFIKPLPMYIDIFGTKKRRILKDGVVGEKYIMVLKHNNNKNFSARSTFRVNRANQPAKDTTKRNNRSSYSHNPIRIGESYNLMSSISGALLAEYNIFMRSSTMGRKSLKRILETEGNPLAIKRLKVQDNYINANADIANAKLKGIGLRLKFFKEGECEEDAGVLIDTIMPLHIKGYTIYDSPLNKPIYNQLFKAFDKYLSTTTIVQTYDGEREDIAWKYVFALPEIQKLNVPEEIREMVSKSSRHQEIDISKTVDLLTETNDNIED